MIALIAAISENRAIGKDGKLLWHLPDDLRHFKQLTTGHPVIMGRKTFESIGKPLPNRTNIIISRDIEYSAPGCMVSISLEHVIGMFQRFGEEVYGTDKVFVIGGGEIYKQALPLADTIYLTKVHSVFEADTFFPEINGEDWVVVEADMRPADDRHKYPFTFTTLKRK